MTPERLFVFVIVFNTFHIDINYTYLYKHVTGVTTLISGSTGKMSAALNVFSSLCRRVFLREKKTPFSILFTVLFRLKHLLVQFSLNAKI